MEEIEFYIAKLQIGKQMIKDLERFASEAIILNEHVGYAATNQIAVALMSIASIYQEKLFTLMNLTDKATQEYYKGKGTRQNS